MNRHSLMLAGFSLALLTGITGCYKYTPPPTAVSGSTFTERKHDKADELLKGIKILTLADAQRIALLNNPDYISTYHSVSAAKMAYYQAIGAYSPVVTGYFDMGLSDITNRRTVNRDSAIPRTDSFTTAVGLRATWLVFDGFARELGVMIASRNLKYQGFMREDECRKLAYSVAIAYNQVMLAIENRRISLENQAFQESSLKDTRQKFEVGAVPVSDVLNFEIQRNAAKATLVSAIYQYNTAIYALAVLMGYPEGILPAEITFPGDFKTQFIDLPNVSVYLDMALANRPDLKAYREQLQIAKYQLGQAYSSYSPTVNAEFDMSYGTDLSRYYGTGSVSSYNTFNHTYGESGSISGGLTVNWTLFNGFIRYNTMREYQAKVAVADFSVASQWLNVVGEVRAAYANYIQNVNLARIYEETRELSAKQRDLVEESYKAGNTELTRLNEAQRDLVEAETALASSYINVHNARAQLDAVVAVNGESYYLNQKTTTLHDTPGLQSAKLPDGKVNTLPKNTANTEINPKPEPAPVKGEKKAAAKKEDKKKDAKTEKKAAPAPVKKEEKKAAPAPVKKEEEKKAAPAPVKKEEEKKAAEPQAPQIPADPKTKAPVQQ